MKEKKMCFRIFQLKRRILIRDDSLDILLQRVLYIYDIYMTIQLNRNSWYLFAQQFDFTIFPSKFSNKS